MQLGFGKFSTLSIHLQGSPASAAWINSQPCLKTGFRERHPDFPTGWVFHPWHCTVGSLTWGISASSQRKATLLHSSPQAQSSWSQGWVMMMQQQGVSVLSPQPLQWPHCAEWDGNVQPEQRGLGSVQPPYFSGEVCWLSNKHIHTESPTKKFRSDHQPHSNFRIFPPLSVDI